MSVTHFLQNRKQQKNASRAGSLSRSATAPSRREPLLVRFFTLCRRRNFCLFFGDFKTIPHPLRRSRPYPEEAMRRWEITENIKNDFLCRIKTSPFRTAKEFFRVSRGRFLRQKKIVLKFCEIRDYLCIFCLLRADIRWCA